jgi:uncharacterized membrane protein
VNPWTVLALTAQWFIVALLALIMIAILLIAIFAILHAAVTGTRQLRKPSNTIPILTGRNTQ